MWRSRHRTGPCRILQGLPKVHSTSPTLAASTTWSVPSSTGVPLAAFAAFLVRNQQRLEALQLGKGGLRTVGYKPGKCFETPIEVYCFRFRSPETFHQGLELFALWSYNSESLDL